MRNYRYVRLGLLLVLISCAGIDRSCSAQCAENLGADWVVVQYDMGGKPLACWKLRNTSITNEQASDGVYWLDTKTRHLVHISGWYNRVQVEAGDYESAASLLGIEIQYCNSGKYDQP